MNLVFVPKEVNSVNINNPEIKRLGDAKIISPLADLSEIGFDRRILYHPYIIADKVKANPKKIWNFMRYGR